MHIPCNHVVSWIHGCCNLSNVLLLVDNGIGKIRWILYNVFP